MASPHEHVPSENVDYSEESALHVPVEEAIRGEPAQEHFTSMAREGVIAPGNEAGQANVIVSPPTVMTQTNMMR